MELGPEIAHGQQLEAEALLSSTWRELKAVYLVLLSFAGKLAGHRVKWLTDNQGVMYIIHSGSKKEHLQEGAIEIYNVRLTHNIKLDVEWIPRSANEYADVISRVIDYDDWSLNPDIFLVLDANWGPILLIALHHQKMHNSLGSTVDFGPRAVRRLILSL